MQFLSQKTSDPGEVIHAQSATEYWQRRIAGHTDTRGNDLEHPEVRIYASRKFPRHFAVENDPSFQRPCQIFECCTGPLSADASWFHLDLWVTRKWHLRANPVSPKKLQDPGGWPGVAKPGFLTFRGSQFRRTGRYVIGSDRNSKKGLLSLEPPRVWIQKVAALVPAVDDDEMTGDASMHRWFLPHLQPTPDGT